MAGSQTLRTRVGQLVAALALYFFTFAAFARAQAPLPPLPQLPASGMPAQDIADIADSVSTPEMIPAPMTGTQPVSVDGIGTVPAGTRVETGFFETIRESIFGKPDPDTWRPLPLSTLFSEGWNEAWVPSPSGSGGAPRQGWINATDGNMYRLWFFTFAQGFNQQPVGNAYLGAYTLYTPLSRRLLLITSIPFIMRNNAVTGLPIIDPTRPAAATHHSYSGFGDISFTPRVLLHETQDLSVTAEMAIVTPTGTQPLAGNTTTLVPAFGVWYNFAGGWAIRGGTGLAIPMNGSGDDLINQLSVGQTLTAHDVPLFGDFTYYLSTVVNTSLANAGQTSVTLTPGIRTHLGNDWYFLAGVPTPLTKDRVAEVGMIFWFMKAW